MNIFFLILMLIPNINTSGEGSLRAMTFNIRYGTAPDGPNSWSHRKSMVFDVITDQECDFIGLQEALNFQVNEIMEACPGYNKIGRSREISPFEGEGCYILYDTSKWILLETKTFWLSNKPERAGSKSWESALPRIATYGKFRSKSVWKDILIYNTHYDHQSETAREKSSELILKHLRKNNKAGLQVILFGDFNSGETEKPVTRILSKTSMVLVDSYRAIYPEKSDLDATFYGWEPHVPGKGKRLDYIFSTPELRITDSKVIDYNLDGRYPSDHMPVYADFVF